MLAAVLDALDASRVAGVVAVVNADIAPAIEAERPPTARRGSTNSTPTRTAR